MLFRVWIACCVLAMGSSGCRHPLRVCATATITPGATVKMAPAIDHSASPVEPRSLVGHAACRGRVALIDIDGLLLNRNMSGLSSLGENPVAMFREKLEAAARDSCVRAVVLRINSPGGGVTASDIMRRDLVEFRRQTGLPVVACLMDVGCGGAYYLATAADVIVAHPTSLVGGIGVILNVYNLQDTMGQFNVFGVAVKAGEYIDLGSPVKALTPESRRMLQELADGFHLRFREAVIAARPAAESATAAYDGRVIGAADALAWHLIDQIGYLDDAVDVARQLGHDPSADLVLYRRDNDRALSPYDITPNIPLQNSLMPISVPGLDRSQLPTFLYMWQPDPLLEKTGGN